jgi:hypothetical protein
MKSELREVFRTFNVVEADLVSSRLAGAGMHPSLQNDQSTLALEGGGVAAGGVRVLVPSDEYQEAVQLLGTSSE